ncbi:hypothetical protein E2L92_21970 [Salmonella enterica subsp. enterica serovar Ibadan]|nr:hypothetical protein [Salmonella enterica subsp. enterica serovar Ibadan]ECF3282120.1 hypothetical protein [Salmonella enterica subsp. enterica serovar Ibadan]
MKNKEIFDKYYVFDPESPTCFYKKGTKEPAGYKQKVKAGYAWVIQKNAQTGKGRKIFMWSIPRIIYEIVNNVTLKPNQFVTHKDLNKDNLHPDNLECGGFDFVLAAKQIRKAYDNFRTVIIPRYNDDYFKDPKDWTDPDAVLRLNVEKLRREKGESLPSRKVGKPQIWS